MNMSAVVSGVIGVLLVATSVGCSHMHRVVNTGDTMLYAVTVQSGKTKFGHGYLPPKAFKTYSGSMKITRSPAPVLSWKTELNGAPVVREVELDSNPYGREIVFEIDGKTVRSVLRDR